MSKDKTFFYNPFYNENKATNRYEFDIKNVDLAIINSIRRVIHANIPILGFMGEGETSIKINKNTGPLHNEIMTHRIGILPLHFTETEVDEFTENTYKFYCSVENSSNDILNVFTNQIKGSKNDIPLKEKELLAIFPPNDITKNHILITRLRPGEALSFDAVVIKSTAKEHASFSPVSLCAFYYNEDASKTKDLTNILEKERTYFKNTFGDPIDVHFMIEPETGLSPKYIFSKAIEILIDKIEKIHKEVDVVSSDKLSIVKNDTIEDTFDLNILEEDDTLGNLFQSIIYNKFIRSDAKILEDKYKMSYIGYYAPHPLDKKIVIRMTLKNDSSSCNENEYILIIKECCILIEKELREVLSSWINFQG
jgi:DNA-directed RNA polymerase alpha subunit